MVAGYALRQKTTADDHTEVPIPTLPETLTTSNGETLDDAPRIMYAAQAGANAAESAPAADGWCEVRLQQVRNRSPRRVFFLRRLAVGSVRVSAPHE